MSSVDNILGLVSHLHSMESSFSAILIEAAMKLASLTDANLFILVETKDGRRFAGKKHLCSLYTSGRLTPVGTDLEMEVDPSVIGLRARYVSASKDSDSTTSLSPLAGTNLSPLSSPLSGVSQCPYSQITSLSGQTPSSSKRTHARAFGEDNPTENRLSNYLKFEAVDLNQGNSLSSAKDDRDQVSKNDCVVSGERHLLTINQSRSPTVVNSASQTDFFVEQPYIETFAGHFLDGEDEFKTILQNQSGSQFEGSSTQSSMSLGQSTSVVSSGRRPDHGGLKPQFDSSCEEDEKRPYDDVFGWNTTEFLAQSIRANNVLGINDSSLADKSSSNHRMFMSLIHEFTKESVKYVPEEKLARKEFVDKIFFNFWLYFPHLDTLHNLGAKISIGKRYYFLKAFVRAGIARGLSSMLGRRATYTQESLEAVDKKNVKNV